MSNKRTGRMPPNHPEKVADRSNRMCEGCHQKPAMNLHHRRFLSRGGRHNIANLVALCGSGNHTGCHGLAHGSNPPQGWAIKAADSRHESAIPFVDAMGRAWLLDDDGGKEEHRGPDR